MNRTILNFLHNSPKLFPTPQYLPAICALVVKVFWQYSQSRTPSVSGGTLLLLVLLLRGSTSSTASSATACETSRLFSASLDTCLEASIINPSLSDRGSNFLLMIGLLGVEESTAKMYSVSFTFEVLEKYKYKMESTVQYNIHY